MKYWGGSQYFDSILTTVSVSLMHCGVEGKSRLAHIRQFENRAIVLQGAPRAEKMDGSKNLLQRSFSLCGLLQAFVSIKVTVRVLCLCDSISHKDEAVAGAHANSRA